ncbi:dual CXXC motif small (seleno)protein, partial [Desulfovibrio sp.]|uniref:dual CXXC motif small (seleno)protein n=1 Tax=Desulfovibrio sp. TaxID=885 RepID=UPI003FD8A056
CPECDHKREIARPCHEACMRCPFCGKRFPLEQFISQADEAMERFLEGLYFDRI